MKHAGIMIVVGIMAMCLAINASAAEKVTVYTSLETDETVKYLEAARRDMPDLEINIIRLSTGELGARMLAEKDNPQADLVWGWAVTDMEEFIPKGLFDALQAQRRGKTREALCSPRSIYTSESICTLPPSA